MIRMYSNRSHVNYIFSHPSAFHKTLKGIWNILKAYFVNVRLYLPRSNEFNDLKRFFMPTHQISRQMQITFHYRPEWNLQYVVTFWYTINT